MRISNLRYFAAMIFITALIFTGCKTKGMRSEAKDISYTTSEYKYFITTDRGTLGYKKSWYQLQNYYERFRGFMESHPDIYVYKCPTLDQITTTDSCKQYYTDKNLQPPAPVTMEKFENDFVSQKAAADSETQKNLADLERKHNIDVKRKQMSINEAGQDLAKAKIALEDTISYIRMERIKLNEIRIPGIKNEIAALELQKAEIEDVGINVQQNGEKYMQNVGVQSALKNDYSIDVKTPADISQLVDVLDKEIAGKTEILQKMQTRDVDQLAKDEFDAKNNVYASEEDKYNQALAKVNEELDNLQKEFQDAKDKAEKELADKHKQIEDVRIAKLTLFNRANSSELHIMTKDDLDKYGQYYTFVLRALDISQADFVE